jgi:hypothetical protein
MVCYCALEEPRLLSVGFYSAIRCGKNKLRVTKVIKCKLVISVDTKFGLLLLSFPSFGRTKCRTDLGEGLTRLKTTGAHRCAGRLYGDHRRNLQELSTGRL